MGPRKCTILFYSDTIRDSPPAGYWIGHPRFLEVTAPRLKDWFISSS